MLSLGSWGFEPWPEVSRFGTASQGLPSIFPYLLLPTAACPSHSLVASSPSHAPRASFPASYDPQTCSSQSEGSPWAAGVSNPAWLGSCDWELLLGGGPFIRPPPPSPPCRRLPQRLPRHLLPRRLLTLPRLSRLPHLDPAFLGAPTLFRSPVSCSSLTTSSTFRI